MATSAVIPVETKPVAYEALKLTQESAWEAARWLKVTDVTVYMKPDTALSSVTFRGDSWTIDASPNAWIVKAVGGGTPVVLTEESYLATYRPRVPVTPPASPAPTPETEEPISTDNEGV